MDKLQWFKFTPSQWMMGKIQRCPEITQARFLRICCLYWNKDCKISIEDAIIEIDKGHFDILVSKKIISTSEGFINISFLDEQMLEIQEISKDKSISGIVGNLKRWHPVIYSRYIAKEISLEKAVSLSKTIATQSLPDGLPIAPQSQSIADKDKDLDKEEEKKKTREEKEKIFNSRKLKFSDTLKPFLETYGKEFLNEFYKYWTEPNKSGTKFKMELQQTWDVERRLETWAKNDKNFNKPKNGTQQPKQQKPSYRGAFQNAADKYGQAESGNTERELFKDTEYIDVTAD